MDTSRPFTGSVAQRAAHRAGLARASARHAARAHGRRAPDGQRGGHHSGRLHVCFGEGGLEESSCEGMNVCVEVRGSEVEEEQKGKIKN